MWFLKEVWDTVTFADFRESSDWTSFVMCAMMAILVLILVGAVIAVVIIVVAWIGYTIYRLIAYDYTIETYSATVTKKKYKPEETTQTFNPALGTFTPITQGAEYNVYIVTKNGLRDMIDDGDLYRAVRKGSKIRVTMKVGRNRKRRPEIKYWRITHFSW